MNVNELERDPSFEDCLEEMEEQDVDLLSDKGEEE